MQAVLAAVTLDDAELLIRAFSTYFQLVNLAEEHERVRRVAELGGGMRKEGIEQALHLLAAEGHDAAFVEKLIGSVDLGLTFTAHPTEMRRRTVRAHLESISTLVPQIDDLGVISRITAHVEALWSTPWLRRRQPTVRDEVNAGLAYVDVIADVLPDLERELELAFQNVFAKRASLAVPLSFHSWMGGDRDGNPFVTSAVTAETFAMHAARARRALDRALHVAFTLLSQSVGGREEPFRARLHDVRLAIAAHDAEALVRTVTELSADLEASGQKRSADVLARRLKVQARIFGLHLSSLDLREHSALTGAAVEELLHRAGIEGYAAKTEDEKSAILLRELATKRPLLAPFEEISPELERVVGPLRAAREACALAGPKAFGRYIVSMSEQPSDLLEVLILAREAGVRLVPVPLFETLDDLARAPDVMRRIFAMPEYRALLGDQIQEVMIGYSDSNKDGGFFAANWALHEAQRLIAAVCAQANVRHRFFHGRGTSIGRGGGPMTRGMLAQPPGTVGAGIRITEQGEALGNKYSHPALAHRNLEQAIFGLLLAAGRKVTPIDEAWTTAMGHASEASAKCYRELVHDEGFLPFFEAVTPIREIARLRIASRPVRRPGPAKLSNLRAIPCVMAWTQCRAIIPGWYGLDAALDSIGIELARDMYKRWIFFRSMIDNAQMALAKGDRALFRAYVELADDKRLATLVEARWARTSELVAKVTSSGLLDDEPVLAKSIALRNPYIDPIHRVQVELLRQARACGEEATLPPKLEHALVLSLHGIAAGMRNTG
ncbi:phosphoenolpyruvate carboxylase [soil metagenome]